MDSDRLASYPWIVVRVACSRCPRRGSYRLARLAERYGADIGMSDLLVSLSADCAGRSLKRTGGSYPQCGAHFPDLHSRPPPHLPPGLMKLRVVQGGKG